MEITHDQFIDCKIHGKSLVYILSIKNSTRKRRCCRICSKERAKKRRDLEKEVPLSYKCSSLCCIGREKYQLEECQQCIARWEWVQFQYAKSFKPQQYQFRWNQI